MASDELITLWTRPPAETPQANFEILREIEGCYAARSPSETAALIVPLEGGGNLPRGRVLGSVRAQYESELSFDVGGRTWTQAAAVIDCLEPRLVRTFAAVVRDVVGRLRGSRFTAKRVVEALSAWDELLRRGSKLSENSELGLWGEIHLITLGEDRDAMVSVWRGPLGETLDFLGGGVALECKTSARRHQHRVSQGQASFEAANVVGYVASVWACEDPPGGKTLADLIDEVMQSVNDESAFLRKLMAAGYREEHRFEYERRFSCPSPPLFFRIELVPRVRTMDEGITNLRYDVDLSSIPSVGADEARVMFEKLTGAKDDD